jgi:hypothetical protein
MLILTACLLPARSAVGLCLAAADSVTDGQAIVDAAIAAYGRLDVVINNAGILTPESWNDLTLESWQRTIDINLTGAKNATVAPFVYKTHHLPRQARDKHSENSKKEWRFVRGLLGDEGGVASAGVAGVRPRGRHLLSCDVTHLNPILLTPTERHVLLSQLRVHAAASLAGAARLSHHRSDRPTLSFAGW